MSTRTIVVGAAALGAGLLAALGSTALRPRPDKANSVRMVVAARDLSVSTVLNKEDIEAKAVDRSSAPAGYIAWPDSGSKNYEQQLQKLYSRLTGRTVRVGLLKDFALTERHLAPKHAGGIAALIPPRKRAVTLSMPQVFSTVAELIQPRSRVDVLSTITDRNGSVTTTTLLENVEVLAVDQRMVVTEEPDSESRNRRLSRLRSVTVLVDPEDANRVELAQNQGTLGLSLRNPEDRQAVRPKMARLWDVQYSSRSESSAGSTPQLYVRTLRGGRLQVVPLPESASAEPATQTVSGPTPIVELR